MMSANRSPSLHSPTSPPGHSISGHGWAPANPSVKTKKLRTSKPKVKTGCRTCKMRRVKCDERKPSCLRCLRFNGECKGYDMEFRRTSPKVILPKPPVPIVPKFSSSCAVTSAPPLHDVRHDSPPSWVAEDPEDPESLYVRYFHEKSAFRMSGYLDKSLWDRLILHASKDEPSVRHAVIAIGALDMALEGVNDTQGILQSPRTECIDRERMSHHQFAMQHYAKAIKQMRDTLSGPGQDMTNTLVACLLFLCFENFNGNNGMVFNEEKGALKLISGWLPQFVKQGKWTHDRVQSPGSHPPCVIEDELIHTFARLDILAMMFDRDGGLKTHPHWRPNILEVCKIMPATFLGVEEARMYWNLMWRQTLQFLANGTSWSSILGLDDLDRMRPGEVWGKAFYDSPKNDDGLEEDCFGGLRQWSSAFTPLLNDSQTRANQTEFAAATSLAVQYKACNLAIAGGFRGEMFYDGHLKTFKEILSMSEGLFTYIHDRISADETVLSIESLVIGSLYMVARMCRHCVTRRRAISMLESTPQRRGTLESVLMAKVAKISMEIEERKLEGNFVPERARIKAVKTQFNVKQRTGFLRYARAKPEPGWEEVVDEVRFSW